MTTTRTNKLRLINGNTNKQPQYSTTNADINIYDVQAEQVDFTNYLYDNQTMIYINSSSNSNLNSLTGVYIDPTSSNINYEASNLSEFLSKLQANAGMNNQYKSIYNIDITNARQSSILSNPQFVATGAYYTNNSDSLEINVVPNYSTSGTSNYLCQSSYLFVVSSFVILVNISISISKTEAMNVLSMTPDQTPVINCTITNRIISKEEIEKGIITSKQIYKKTITLQSGDNFKSSSTDYYMNNICPLIFAPGCKNEWINISIAYIPPFISDGTYYGQYLPQDGFVITNNDILFDFEKLVETGQKTTYGYFLTAFSFPILNGKYSSYLVNGIQSELLIKNIWRSPISIFNGYKNYSVSQMTLLNVVLLFGTNSNGSLFLALNTGTSIDSMTNYGLTSLNNFINIMRAFVIEFDNNSQLADYFIDETTINNLKEKGYNVNLVSINALIDTNTISNPKTILSNKNLTYFLLHSPNNTNLIMDTTEQNIINGNIQPLDSNELQFCSIGNFNYSSSSLTTLKTNNNYVFPNTITYGLQSINGKLYNTNIILPESNFKPNYDTNNSLINIYKDLSSCYYITSMPYSERFDKLLSIDNGIAGQKSMSVDRISFIVSNNNIF